MIPPAALPVAALRPGEIIVDLFAGGGGASTGIEAALGQNVFVAINHDPAAIAMHQRNHPQTRHYCKSVFDVSPSDATDGHPVGLLWASPDCTHHSRAKGGKPRDQGIRDLAWVIVTWAAAVSPRVISMENVPEFLSWGPLDAEGFPVKAQAGETFREFIAQLRALGYVVEWRVLCAADYDAPTIRRRLYLVARRDGVTITWPEPTNGDGRALPWRPAAECIDWTDLGSSIFGRRKPLAESTCRRIAAGVMRYVLKGQPFIMPCNHGGDARVHAIDQPLRTATKEGSHALCTAFLSKYYSTTGGRQDHCLSLSAPMATVTAVDHHALVACSLATLRGTDSAHLHGDDCRAPLRTVAAGGCHHALVAAFLTTYYSGGGTANACNVPMPVITTRARHGLVTVTIDRALYALADIRLRMLQPRELARAQGFPDDYVLTGTKKEQYGRIGNSVCPPVAAAIIAAQFSDAPSLVTV